MAKTRFWRQGTEEGGGSDSSPSNLPVPVKSLHKQAEEELTRARARSSQFLQTADACLVDVSDSTKEEADEGKPKTKNEALIEAVTAFVANHPEGCELAIVVFNDDARVVLPLQDVSNKKMDVISDLYALGKPSGGTLMVKPIVLAGQQLIRSSPEKKRRVYLMTDGLPQDGPRQAAEDLKAQGVELTTVGFGIRGQNIDEDLLREMASIGVDGKPLYRHFSDAAGLTSFMARSSRML